MSDAWSGSDGEEYHHSDGSPSLDNTGSSTDHEGNEGYVSNELELDLGDLSDSQEFFKDDIESKTSSSAVVCESSTALAPSKTFVDMQLVSAKDLAAYKKWYMRENKRATKHFLDLDAPHLFAGFLHPHLLLNDNQGVASLHPHVSQQELLRLLYLVTEPDRMSYSARHRALLFVKSTESLSTPLVICSGSARAQRFLDRELDDGETNTQIFGPNSQELRRVPRWAHLCHLGEALYLRWLLDGVMPRLIWHVVLLMFTAQRMAVRAMYHPLDERVRGGVQAQHLIHHMVAGGYWDDLKAKYEEVKQSLQANYPAWREKIGTQLQQYADQATTAVKQAYSKTKEWAADAQLAYEQQLKPWLQQQYSEKVKPLAAKAWNSTREGARNLVKYAEQARAYVGQHMSELMQRIKNDPRLGQLKDKLFALSQEAKQSGILFWDYVKQQLEAGNVKAKELLEEVRKQMNNIKIRLSQPKPLDYPEPINSTIEQSVSSTSTSTPSSPSKLNRWGAPETENGVLDVDFIDDYRSYTQNLGRPKASLPTNVTSNSNEPPDSFFAPKPPSEQEDLFTEPPGETMFVEPLPIPPPVPPRDYQDYDDDDEKKDDMLQHMPTSWQSNPQAANMDAKRLAQDLQDALNQVQWWLSGSNSAFYNPVIVSSTLSLIEQVRDGIPAEMGGGTHHSNANHNNPVYQLMQKGTIYDDDAKQLHRNQEVQRLVGVANRIMVQAFYGQSSSSRDGTLQHNGYAIAATELLESGRLQHSELEDLMAFIEALEDQQVELDAMKGPFDRVAKAAAEVRTSGRAYMHEQHHHLHAHGGAPTLVDIVMEKDLDAQKSLEQEQITHRALHQLDSGLIRCAVFKKTKITPCMVQDKELLMNVGKLFHQVDNGQSPNIAHAACVMRASKFMPSKRFNIPAATDSDYASVMKQAHLLNWLYSLGGLLEITHDISPTAASADYTPLHTTWNLIIQPAITRVCAEHNRCNLYEDDSLQLHHLDQEFNALLRDLARDGIISTNYSGQDSAGKVVGVDHAVYTSVQHAKHELARVLHACQPLPQGCSRHGTHWHAMWEQITALQVKDLHLPPGLIAPHTPIQFRYDPHNYWKNRSHGVDVSIAAIVYRLERATELERRCARAHTRRQQLGAADSSVSTAHHLHHLEKWMRVQRCWAIRTLRTFPEHWRQYVLLRIEAALGPLSSQNLIPWPVHADSDSSSGSESDTEDSVNDLLAQDEEDKLSIAMAAQKRTKKIYPQPVAFHSTFLHESRPTPLSACAVMLEVRAARSWEEVSHIFTSYGLQNSV
jgi:hypothetical protein